LDTLVESAGRAPGTLGARMTGAGFGGCTVNLVRSDSVSDFVEFVRREFRSKTGGECEVHVCRPSAGVGFERIAREE
jgi:galactokinase